jgi:hypothetical protein
MPRPARFPALTMMRDTRLKRDDLLSVLLDLWLVSKGLDINPEDMTDEQWERFHVEVARGAENLRSQWWRGWPAYGRRW